jgi:DNA-binding transcriptional ArsR family regulator
VLLRLIRYANHLGRCFPSAEKIADDLGKDISTIYRHLSVLEDRQYIVYLRRNQSDPVTGRTLPNVYAVNPGVICLGEEHRAEAVEKWHEYHDTLKTNPLAQACNTNQQQEPAPVNQHHNNQRQKPTTTTTAIFSNGGSPFANTGSTDAHGQTAPDGATEKSEKPILQLDRARRAEQQREAQQHEVRQEKQVFRANYNSRYKTPPRIDNPLDDDKQEALAQRVRDTCRIPLKMTRGFILVYGWDTIETVLLQVNAAMDSGQEVKNPGGLYRYLLQKNLSDKALTAPREKDWSDYSEKDFTGGKWADIIES